MERLSNIMRTTQRSYLREDRRGPQQFPAQGQRTPASARRPQAEQQRERPNNTGYPQARPATSAHLPEIPENQWEAEAPPRSPLSRANYGGQRREHAGQGPARYIEQGSRYAEQPPQGDYYEEEGRLTTIPADAQEDWGDDTAGMRYGDWEDEPGYNYASHYRQTNDYTPPVSRPGQVTRPPTQEISAVAQRLAQVHNRENPLATRQLYSVAPDQPRPAAQRDPYRVPSVSEQEMRDPQRRVPLDRTHVASPRDARLPVPAPGSQLTPAQPGARSTQRNTQPLKPRQIARVHGEMHSRQPILPQTPRGTGADYTITVQSAPMPTSAVCPICHGAGFLRSNVAPGHPQFGKPVACQCKELERKRKRRQQLFELSNLGIFADKRFESFNPRVQGLQEAFQISVEFAKDPGGWLLFVGPNGCGKTHLAAAIANSCLEAGSVVLFATVPDLLDHLRAAFAPDSEEIYDQLFARMREAEVLVLDDLGTQQSSPWASEKLFQLLNYRYNSGFPT
ncbi:MAG: ATP-binding protein, partial [Ktedonobacteraceae bacterium]